MLVGVATTALPILTIVTQFVKMYPQNIDLATNKQDKVGGNDDVKLSLMRGLKPMRRRKSSFRKNR